MVKDINWELIDSELGTVSDYKISSKYGIHRNQVRSRRAKLGIPVHIKPKPDWDSVLNKLGTVPDDDIAEELGISNTAVYKKRLSLGIPPCGNPRRLTNTDKKGVDWFSVEHLLGKIPDAEIAAQLGVKSTSVKYQRTKRNIPSFRQHKIDWTLIDPELGKCYDQVLADKYGISYASVILRRQSLGIEPFYPNVNRNKGRVIDFDFTQHSNKSHQELAEELGVSKSYIGEQFRSNGIITKRRRLNWKLIIPYLGTMPDKEVANMFGVSRSVICAKRNELGIAAFLIR